MNTSFSNRSASVEVRDFSSYDAWFYAITAVSVVGLAAFGLVYMAILGRRANRSGIGWLILHQLVIEGPIVFIFYPINNVLGYLAYHKLPVPKLDCAGLYLVVIWFGMASYWSAVFMACSRYIAIFLPHRFKMFSRAPSIVCMIILTHFIGIALNLPGYFGVGFALGSHPTGECGITNFGKADFANVRSVLGYYLPLSLAGCIYLVTIFKYHCTIHRRTSTDRVDNTASRTIRRRYKLTKVFLFAHAWIFCCYIPTPLAISIAPWFFAKYRMAALWFRFVLTCGYVANPIILLALNSAYRRVVVRLGNRIKQKVIRSSAVY